MAGGAGRERTSSVAPVQTTMDSWTARSERRGAGGVKRGRAQPPFGKAAHSGGECSVFRGAYYVLRKNNGTRTTQYAPRFTPPAPRRSLLAVQLSIVVWTGATLLVLSLPAPPAIAFPLLALATGGLTGMAFPLAVALAQPRPTSTGAGAAGMVYGADLVGGCLGALLSAVVWVPLLGIPQTCAVIALVGVAGLLALA